MTTEQLLLKTWRQLPETMRQEGLHVAQFLAERGSFLPSPPNPSPPPSKINNYPPIGKGQ